MNGSMDKQGPATSAVAAGMNTAAPSPYVGRVGRGIDE
jgi:hypothetical protein